MTHDTPGARELLAMFSAADARKNAADLAKTYAKDKALKAIVGDYAKLSYPAKAEILQLALDKPTGHPLRLAAESLLDAGVIDWPVWTAIDAGAQPKRSVEGLRTFARDPRHVYALEKGATVSQWSVETGAHVQDFKLGAGPKDQIVDLVETAEGGIRGVTLSGTVWERAPGAAGFVKRYDAGAFELSGHALSPDLLFLLTVNDSPWPQGLRAQLHDIAGNKRTDLHWAGTQLTHSGIAFVSGRFAFGAYTFVDEPINDEGRKDKLLLVDTVTGKADEVAMRARALSVCPSAHERRILVRGRGDVYVEVDVVTRKTSPSDAPPPAWNHGDVRVGPLKWDGTGPLTNKEGFIVASFTVKDRFNWLHTCGAYAEALDRLVVAGHGPAQPVTVGARYRTVKPTAGSETSAPVDPLVWARPGAKLTYRIADEDAEDDYVFEVVEAGDDLVLAIRMGRATTVADSVRFTASALEKAASSMRLAQGGTDTDLSRPVTKVTAPFLISRVALGKLAAGKKIPWHVDAFPECEALEPGGAARALVRVGEGEREVATRSAGGDGVSLVVLDDPKWPLVVARSEGESFVRLVSIDLPAAGASPLSPRPAQQGRAASTPTAAGRRFELVEGGSAKFWQVAIDGAAFTVLYGKIGTSGQAQTKSFASAELAQKEAEKLVREKVKKGYVEQA